MSDLVNKELEEEPQSRRDPNFSKWAITMEGVRVLVLPSRIKSVYLDRRLLSAAETAWNAARKLYSTAATEHCADDNTNPITEDREKD